MKFLCKYVLQRVVSHYHNLRCFCKSAADAVLRRSTGYDRKRHYDGADNYSYVGSSDMRSAKESRVVSHGLMTADMTGSLTDVAGTTLPPPPQQQFPLLMAPPAPWQTLPTSDYTQSSLQHSNETVSATVSLPPTSAMHH